MRIVLASVIAALFAGCASVPAVPVPAEPSACANNEASYACQVERYHNVHVD